MSIFRDSFVKQKPIFTGISRGVGGFGYGASGGGGAASVPHVDYISGLSGNGQQVTTGGVTFYQANHALQLNNPGTAPYFEFTTAQPFYIAMIGASGASGYNSASAGLGGIGVALITPNASTTYRVWSGVGGYWSTNNNSSKQSVQIGGGQGGLGNQSGLSPSYNVQGGGGGAGGLVSGTGSLTTSTVLAMVGSGGGSGNQSQAQPSGHGGGFNRAGLGKAPPSEPVINNGLGAPTSGGGAGGSWTQGSWGVTSGGAGSQFQGGVGGNSNYDGGHGGGSGWYGGGGGSGGGGYSGGAGGGGSGKTQGVMGTTVDLSPPLTNTADGSTTGGATLQTWIRAASGVEYVIPNSGNYGMQAPGNGAEGHSGWACVWSYHPVS